MKRTVICFVLALICFSSYSQVPSSCSAPSILLSEYDVDVKDLALSRILFLETADTAEINIPTSYQDTIWDGLAAIFNVYSDFQRDSVFDIYCIHNASPSYTSLFNELFRLMTLMDGHPLGQA